MITTAIFPLKHQNRESRKPASSKPARQKSPRAEIGRNSGEEFSTREERIDRALDDFALKLTSRTKLYTSLWAGISAGSAIASLLPYSVFTTPVLLGAGAVAGMGAEHFHLGSRIKNRAAQMAESGFLGLGQAFKAISNILYPTIQGATQAQRAVIESALDTLPLKTVASTAFVKLSENLPPNVQGLNHLLPGAGTEIFFNPEGINTPGFNAYLVAHEFGHSKDQLGLMTSLHPGGPWGKAPFITDYASTGAPEDFAESHANYFTHPDLLKQVAPAKYQAMQQLNQPDMETQLFDHPAIREAGKHLSQAIDTVPGLRNLLEAAAALSAPLLLHRGAGQLEKGIKTDDPLERANGKFNFAKGTAFALKLTAPVGLGLGVLQLWLNRRVKQGKMSPQKAEKYAGAALACMTGPVGISVHNALKEVKNTDLPEEKISGQKLTRNDKGLLKKTFGGAALGGAAATFAAVESAMVIATLAAAGPVGLALCAVALTLAGSYAGSKAGAKLGSRLHRRGNSGLKQKNTASLKCG